MEYELTSEGMEDKKALPIWLLKLDNKLFDLMNIYKVKSPYGDRFIKTIGDLVEVGEEPFSNFVHAHFDFVPATEMVVQTQEQLGTLGLRMKDSNFSASNIRLSAIEHPKAVKKIMEYATIETIDDLANLGKKYVRKIIGEYSLGGMREIEKFLERYGTKFDDSKFEINPENVFLVDISTLYSKHMQKLNEVYHKRVYEEKDEKK